jgi:hypothetical protein
LDPPQLNAIALDRDTVLEHSGRMERDYLDEVKAIVSELRGESLDRLTATIRLAHDLAIEGDDAEEFLRVFSSRLHVDLSEFEFARHSSGEAIIPELRCREQRRPGAGATIATRGLTNAEADKESADCAGLRPALLFDFLAA